MKMLTLVNSIIDARLLMRDYYWSTFNTKMILLFNINEMLLRFIRLLRGSLSIVNALSYNFEGWWNIPL